MKTGYVVADIMTTKPVTCGPSDSLRACAELMRQYEVGSLLVKDDGDLAGIVTAKDFLFKATAGGLPLDRPVSDIMTSSLTTVSPGADVVDAVKLMNKHDIRHLPVLEDGTLVGYLTMTTVLKIEPQLLELLTDRIELRGIRPDSPLLAEVPEIGESGRCESCGNYSTRLVENEGRMVCPNCVLR